jgi:hypothetical protein
MQSRDNTSVISDIRGKTYATLTGRVQECSEFYNLFSDNVSRFRQIVLPLMFHIYIPSSTINASCMARY